VLTKGTKTLSNQTVARFKKDFAECIEEDTVSLFDVMQMPPKLTRSERDRKLIFIAKKQVQNLSRILKPFGETYPDLHSKKVLLVDDEADLASVRFVKNKETDEHDQGRIAQQMDNLRRLVDKLAFLQVTATPFTFSQKTMETVAVTTCSFPSAQRSRSSCLFTARTGPHRRACCMRLQSNKRMSFSGRRFPG
jgi:hypothetical protein